MKKIIHTPHDRFFRATLSDSRVAKEFFEFHLPAKIRDRINLDHLTLRKDSYVDEELQQSEVDMLFDVTFSGQVGYLYLLVEHQSSPDRLMAFRLLKYLIAIMNQHLKTTQGVELPLIYPLIFYTGKAKYPYSTDLFDLFGVQCELAREIFFQPFKLIELNKIPDEVLKERLWAGIMELTMKHIFDRDVLSFVKDMLSLFQQVERLDGANYVKTILTYLVKTGEVQDKKLFFETIERGLSPEVNEVVMTIAEQIKTEGFQKGIEQGIEVGIEKGEMNAKRIIAKNLLQDGMSCEAVSRFTGLSLQDLQRLGAAGQHH